MTCRTGIALILLLTTTPTARAVTDLRGVRMELPGLFEEATPREIVENVASVHLNAILCTVHPPILNDARFPEMLRAAHARGIAVHVVLSTIVAGARSGGCLASPEHGRSRPGVPGAGTRPRPQKRYYC